MYSARITRQNPTAFIILIDRSGSMEEKICYGTSYQSKAEVVANVTNMLIRELINRCRREEGIMDYFDIAAIGYSDDKAEMLLGTPESFAKPSVLAVADCPTRIYTHERVLPNGNTFLYNDELKQWIEPQAQGNTPMRAALEQAMLLAARWCRRTSNSRSYPPTIINITDGEASDGDHQILTAIAEQIKSLRTENGNALLININISAGAYDHALLFPSSKNELPICRYADMLYDMSSVMPEAYNSSIEQIKKDAKPPFRGMSLNTSAENLIAMMNIGSRSINKIV